MKKCVFYLVLHCQTQMKGSWATWRGSDSSQLASGYLLRWSFSFPQFSPLEAFLSSVALKSSRGNHCNVHWCDLLHILYHIFVIKRSQCSFRTCDQVNPSFQVYAVTPASAESKPQPVECSILLFFQFVPLRDEGEGDKNRYIGSGVTSICID